MNSYNLLEKSKNNSIILLWRDKVKNIERKEYLDFLIRSKDKQIEPVKKIL